MLIYTRHLVCFVARFVVMARASLMESQNHLIDAVDRGYITEDVRREHDALAEAALQEVTGLMEYLQSPEALRNARRARERRIASRPNRTSRRTPNKERSNPEPERERELEHEHEPEPEHEPSSENKEG